jgi:pantothenate kinase type III
LVNSILFVFTRGPIAGNKILVENASNLIHAMDFVRAEQPATVVKSNTQDAIVSDVFDHNDFEVIHIRRRFDAEVPPIAQDAIMTVKT